jgi:hypothetical protein
LNWYFSILIVVFFSVFLVVGCFSIKFRNFLFSTSLKAMSSLRQSSTICKTASKFLFQPVNVEKMEMNWQWMKQYKIKVYLRINMNKKIYIIIETIFVLCNNKIQTHHSHHERKFRTVKNNTEWRVSKTRENEVHWEKLDEWPVRTWTKLCFLISVLMI